jgi:hypothetical protein
MGERASSRRQSSRRRKGRIELIRAGGSGFTFALCDPEGEEVEVTGGRVFLTALRTLIDASRLGDGEALPALRAVFEVRSLGKASGV